MPRLPPADSPVATGTILNKGDDNLPIPVVPRPPSATSPAVSRSMVGNRRRDTSPELQLRSELHARGWRFRVDMRLATEGPAKPRPDLVFTRRKVAVFVDGCFWHGCPEHGSVPKSNRDYWLPKLCSQCPARSAEHCCSLRRWLDRRAGVGARATARSGSPS